MRVTLKVIFEVILFLYILLPSSVGCSPPETVSLALDPTLKGTPSYDAEDGTGPGGDSRPRRQMGSASSRVRVRAFPAHHVNLTVPLP